MEPKDALAQYYLKMSEEAANERRMDGRRKVVTATLSSCETGSASTNSNKGSSSSSNGNGRTLDQNIEATVDAAFELLPSHTSKSEASIYEGDDELDQRDSPLPPSTFPGPNVRSPTQGGMKTTGTASVPSAALRQKPSSLLQKPTTVVDLTSSGSAASDEPVVIHQEEEGVDFVHVHLEHLPSTTQEGDDDDEDEMGPKPLMVEVKPPRKRATSPSVIYQMVSGESGTNGAAFSYYRKFASEGSGSLTDPDKSKSFENGQQQPQQKQQPPAPRSNPLVASLQQALSFGSTKRDAVSVMSGNTEQAVMTRRPSNHPRINSTSARKQVLQGAMSSSTHGSGQPSFNDGIVDPENNDFDFVNMNVTETVNNREQAKAQIGKYNPPPPPPPPPIGHNNSLPADNTYDSGTNNQATFSDAEDQLNPITGLPNNRSYHSAGSGTGTYTGTATYSESDTDNIDRRSSRRKQRIIFTATPSRDDEYRLSWLETVQHNTRANFCAIFLLAVALTVLILMVIAKMTTNRERLYYDEEEDNTIVVTDSDMLLTIEVLALGLIIVLLIGSCCYLCGAAIDGRKRIRCDSASSSLVDQVKHEDACFANSSGRRRHPNYRAPYSDPPGKLTSPNSHTENEQSENTSLENQTFSYLSETEQTLDDNDDVLITMEEAENQGGCCSPLSINQTVSEPFLDEDDAVDDDSGASREKPKKKKGFFSRR